MASKRVFRARGSKVMPSGKPVRGTEVLPTFKKRTVLERGFLGIPRKVEERVQVGTRHSGVPYVNPDKDRSLRGKARRRARRAERRVS